jgi:hypothetical protein
VNDKLEKLFKCTKNEMLCIKYKCDCDNILDDKLIYKINIIDEIEKSIIVSNNLYHFAENNVKSIHIYHKKNGSIQINVCPKNFPFEFIEVLEIFNIFPKKDQLLNITILGKNFKFAAVIQ